MAVYLLRNSPNTSFDQASFAYQKLIEILCRSVIDPEHYFVLTGTYRIPLACGLTAQKQIEDVINSPSFSKDSFEREYESIWSDAPIGAAFSSSLITSLRSQKIVELKDKRTAKQIEDGVFYVVSADMAKDGAAETAVIVAKVTPREHYFTYKIVNLFPVSSTDYMVVANSFKKAVIAYNAKLLVYDANGVGAGIRDWLNKQTTDNVTGEILEGLGIINPPTESEKDIIRYPKDKTICYEIKSGGKIGERIHWFLFSRMSTGAVTFPLKLSEALNLYSSNKSFMQMSRQKQQEFLFPFKIMDKAEEQLKNLDIANTSDNMTNSLRVTRRNGEIQKDYFSTLEYLVWAVNQHFELEYYRRRKNRKGNGKNQKQYIFID